MTYQQQSFGVEVADHYGLRAQLGQTMGLRARGELARKPGGAALNMAPERIEQIAEQARAAQFMPRLYGSKGGGNV